MYTTAEKKYKLIVVLLGLFYTIPFISLSQPMFDKKEGMLGASGFFYSQTYLENSLISISEFLEINLTLDSLSFEILRKAGEQIYLQGNYNKAIEFFKLGHDICEKLGIKKRIAPFYLNIGVSLKVLGQYSEALWFYDKSEKLSSTESALSLVYHNKGAIYTDLNKFAKAETYFNKSIRIREKLGNLRRLAESFNGIGYLYLNKGNYAKAFEYFEKAIGIRETLGPKAKGELAISYSNLGSLYSSLRKYGKALKWYYKAREIREELGSLHNLANTIQNIGALFLYQNKFDQAGEHFVEALEIRQEIKDSIGIARSYRSIGTTFGKMGMLEQAITFYKAEQAILINLEQDSELAQSFHNIAKQYISIGNFTNALFYLEKAEKLWEQLDFVEDLAHTLDDIGSVYSNQKDLYSALRYFKKAQKLRDDHDLELKNGETYKSLGFLYASVGDLEKAIYYNRKGIELEEKLGITPELAIIYNNMGHLYMEQGDFGMAKYYLKKALKVNKRLNNLESQSFSLINLGTLYGNQGKNHKAKKTLMKAKELCEDLGLEGTLTTALTSLTNLHLNNLDVQTALFIALENVKHQDRLRNNYNGHADRLLIQQRSRDIIRTAVYCASLLGMDSLMYPLIQRSKNRIFYDLLAEKPLAKTELPAEIIKDHQNINIELEFVNSELSQKITGKKRQSLVSQRDSLYQRKMILVDRMRILAPEYANLVYPKLVQLNEVQKTLKMEEIVVEYYFSLSFLHAIVITNNSIEVINMGKADSLQILIDDFRNDFILPQQENIESNNKSILSIQKEKTAFFRISKALYQTLWAPLEENGLLEGQKEIIIIPDGILNTLPFEFLIKDQMLKGYSRYNYLIKNYSLIYYPSLNLLYHKRTKNIEPQKWDIEFFGVAVSNFDSNNCYDYKTTFPRLNESISEVEAIANEFPDNHYSLLGTNATEEFFKSPSHNLNIYRYIHLSTHSFINTETADFSRILLTPSGNEDGCLNLYEIFRLDLGADLVSLSACETGLGKLVQGEGVIGFTRALMYAGTPSVILSMWQVADNSSKELFVKYYRALTKNSRNKYAPLRAAQLGMIDEGGEFANPFYWAPFVFIGAR